MKDADWESPTSAARTPHGNDRQTKIPTGWLAVFLKSFVISARYTRTLVTLPLILALDQKMPWIEFIL